MSAQTSFKGQPQMRYLSEVLPEILRTIGPRPSVDSSRLTGLARRSTAKECIDEICRAYGLPINVQVTYISSHYVSNSSDGFRSNHIVTADSHGSQGIIAQVAIPMNLPIYVSSSMDGFKIDVRLQENCFDYPARFVTIMAHEMSHVLLYSLRHPEKQNEFFTDMTAIASGFGQVMRDGRKIIHSARRGNYILTQTDTVGYLNDHDFEWVLSAVEDESKVRSKELKQIAQRIRSAEKIALQAASTRTLFDMYLRSFELKRASNFSPDESARMARYFRPGFLEQFDREVKSVLRTTETERPIVRGMMVLSREAMRSAKAKLINIERMSGQPSDAFNELVVDVRFMRSKLPLAKVIRVHIGRLAHKLRSALKQTRH